MQLPSQRPNDEKAFVLDFHLSQICPCPILNYLLIILPCLLCLQIVIEARALKKFFALLRNDNDTGR
nr:MAG: hypothetical protein DIU61_14285 [Bacteroidota bacterium]